MDEAQWWIIYIVAPALMLIALIWLVMKRRSNRRPDQRPGDAPNTEAGTRSLYAEEETRRREGTDGL